MNVIAASGHRPIKCWTDGVELEDAARQQLLNVASLPFIHRHVAVMPDVHWGMGATVGSVIPTRGAIVPAAVGVDIGCGMIYQRTTLTANDLTDNLKAVREAIERRIPHGRTNNGGAGDWGAWHDVPADVALVWTLVLVEGYAWLKSSFPKIVDRDKNNVHHLGTLGTGNHFVEVTLDEEQRVGVLLHSGSRGIGNAIGRYFIERAKEEMARWFVSVPDDDLAYLPEGTPVFDDYMRAVAWAQAYARENRALMLNFALRGLALALDRPLAEVESDEVAVSCHHNYVARETHFGDTVWLTRKGAVSAKPGELGIIPGSMGARSYIVRGKGNPESFMSCSHGAGRRMSRGEAKRRFTLADHEAATAGVECRKDADVIDETPGAYKSIDAVMAAQADLVEIVHALKGIVCVKG